MRSFLSLKKDCLKVRNYGKIFSPGSESGFRRENECRFMRIRIHSHGHGHHKHLKKSGFGSVRLCLRNTVFSQVYYFRLFLCRITGRPAYWSCCFVIAGAAGSPAKSSHMFCYCRGGWWQRKKFSSGLTHSGITAKQWPGCLSGLT